MYLEHKRGANRGPTRPGDMTALAGFAPAALDEASNAMVTATNQHTARPLTPNDALSGCGPTEHQETRWSVPAVRLNA
jgi:hypothetical protein